MSVIKDLIQQRERRRVRVYEKRMVVVCYGEGGMNVSVVGCVCVCVCVRVRVRLNPQRRKRCLWIRTPRGVPPFSVTPGLPGNQTSQRLDVPRPSFDLL